MSPDADPAADHATSMTRTLADQLDVTVPQPCTGPAWSSAEDWAASGAMALTGRRDGPALLPVGAPASAVRGALAVLRAVAGDHDRPLAEVDERLLGERAAIVGLTRRGPGSAGGAFQLLPTADGWVGANLPRDDDLDLLGALTLGAVSPDRSDPWPSLAEWLVGQPTEAVVARAHLLGLPLVAVPSTPTQRDEQLDHRWGADRPTWVRLSPGGARRREERDRPLVVSLASLWAGPLAAHLLGLAGARVVTVESSGRPDGARRGPRAFHDLLHAGQEMVALDLPDPVAARTLQALVSRADLVVDGSRPRAMAQLGIDVEEVVAGGTSWVSITGYGRTGPWANVPAFGDDAAVAAGLVAWDGRGPVPAGDAMADPLAGVHAAAAGQAALASERAWLVDVAMRDVAWVAATLRHDSAPADPAVEPESPSARTPSGPAHPLGADTRTVLDGLGITG